MKSSITTQFLLLVLLSFLILPASAAIVDQATAEKAARNFLYEKLNQSKVVAYTDVVVSFTYAIKENGLPIYYGINFRDGGFVIITADDRTRPVVGYSPDGYFQPENQPENFKYWMDGVTEQVTASRAKSGQASTRVTAQWTRLTDDSFAKKPIEKSSKNVDPLVASHWNQDKYFNSMCPVDPAGPEGRALTGCVATAMAQVINYYRYPTQGVGTHTYNTNTAPAPHGHYGILTVNYAATNYDFNAMVNDPTESNLEISKLMYHCGVSVSMQYGPTASGAQQNAPAAALISHFHYALTTSYAQRSNYTIAVWHSLLLNDLNAKHPVLYGGSNSAYGHCFVADGYQISTSDTLYHFNWGWGGAHDGFFNINDLDPENDPNGPFSSYQGMTKGIYPAISYPYQCTGQTIITSAKGSIEDGSSFTSKYNDNADCSWLIAPTDSVKKLTLTFNRFATESGNDIVNVYNGADVNAPLLLSASGNALPATVSSTGNRMLVTFHTNSSVNDEGWLATFTPVYPSYCSGTTLTTSSGTITDGSGDRNYNNLSNCNWIINPPNPDNKTLILEFTSFDTEPNGDVLKVYDLVSQQQIGTTYSGNTLPPTLVAPSGQMYIEFKTNYVYNYSGWSANYSLGFIGIDEANGFREMKIYPNPANDHLNIIFNLDATTSLTVELLSLTGQSVIKENYSNFSGSFNKSLDLSSIARGVYALRLASDKGVFTQKVVVQ